MVRLVTENSPEEIARARARSAFEAALVEFAAQIMRLSAGGGSAYAFSQRLGAFLESLDEARASNLRLSTFEMQEVLDFTERDPDEVDFDRIALHSLRLAASRLQRIRVQAAREQSNIGDAIRDRVHALEARRREWLNRPKPTRGEMRAILLTEAQKRALSFYAAERAVQFQMQRPHPNTIKVMVRDGLLSSMSQPALTELGRETLALVEARLQSKSPEDLW